MYYKHYWIGQVGHTYYVVHHHWLEFKDALYTSSSQTDCMDWIDIQ